jgi:hypothetical protein
VRGDGLAQFLLFRESEVAGVADDQRSRPLLGTGHGANQRHENGCVHAHCFVIDDGESQSRLRVHGRSGMGAGPDVGLYGALFGGYFQAYPNLKPAPSEGEVG